MENSKETLVNLLMRKVHEEIDPEIEDIIKNFFNKSEFCETKEISIEDILREIYFSESSRYFKKLREIHEDVSVGNLKESAFKIKNLDTDFFNKICPKNSSQKESIISYLLFSDYLLENTKKFSEAYSSIQENLNFANARMSRLEKIAEGRENTLSVKLYMLFEKYLKFLPFYKKLDSLSEKPNVKKRFGKSLKSYFKTREKMETLKDRVSSYKNTISEFESEKRKIESMGLALADKAIRRYQNQFHTYEERIHVLPEMSKTRIRYTKRLVEVDGRNSTYSIYVDALVKHARLINGSKEKMKLLNKAKHYISKIGISERDFGTTPLAYLSLYALTNLQANGKTDWDKIPIFYNLMREFNEKIRRMDIIIMANRKTDLEGIAHTIKHSNEDFSKFLSSIKNKERFRSCLEPISTNPLKGFIDIYSRFLRTANNWITAGIISKKDRASYKKNPYEFV